LGESIGAVADGDLDVAVLAMVDARRALFSVAFAEQLAIHRAGVVSVEAVPEGVIESIEAEVFGAANFRAVQERAVMNGFSHERRLPVPIFMIGMSDPGA
jgi:hypothetical protein